MFRIARDAVDARTLEAILRDGDGGFVTFVGIVRGRGDDGRAVSGLSYEAYEPLAQAAFEEIAGEARERFGDVRIAIVHRIGELSVGDVAVAVAAAAAASGGGLRRMCVRRGRTQTPSTDLEEGGVR